eukprot:2307708-Amphidinium_carterae.1
MTARVGLQFVWIDQIDIVVVSYEDADRRDCGTAFNMAKKHNKKHKGVLAGEVFAAMLASMQSTSAQDAKACAAAKHARCTALETTRTRRLT